MGDWLVGWLSRVGGGTGSGSSAERKEEEAKNKKVEHE